MVGEEESAAPAMFCSGQASAFAGLLRSLQPVIALASVCAATIIRLIVRPLKSTTTSSFLVGFLMPSIFVGENTPERAVRLGRREYTSVYSIRYQLVRSDPKLGGLLDDYNSIGYILQGL